MQTRVTHVVSPPLKIESSRSTRIVVAKAISFRANSDCGARLAFQSEIVSGSRATREVMPGHASAWGKCGASVHSSPHWWKGGEACLDGSGRRQQCRPQHVPHLGIACESLPFLI